MAQVFVVAVLTLMGVMFAFLSVNLPPDMRADRFSSVFWTFLCFTTALSAFYVAGALAICFW